VPSFRGDSRGINCGGYAAQQPVQEVYRTLIASEVNAVQTVEPNSDNLRQPHEADFKASSESSAEKKRSLLSGSYELSKDIWPHTSGPSDPRAGGDSYDQGRLSCRKMAIIET